MARTRNAVIECAGVSSDPGISTPACLTCVGGRPLIHRQLDLFEDYDNVVIVVGFKAARVMEAVLARRDDAVFAVNHDFESGREMDSLRLGVAALDGPFFLLDGSLVLSKEAVELIENAPNPSVGIRRTRSLDPVCVEQGPGRRQRMVTAFTRELRSHEWAGVASLHTRHVLQAADADYIYQAVERLLPVAAVEIDSVAVETDLNHREERFRRTRPTADLLAGLAGA